MNWLRINGVRYVALAAAPLDYAGVAEGRLVEAGVPGLALVWHDADWRVYRVARSDGIVSGPARLLSMEGDRVTIAVERSGPILLRAHWSPNWKVASADATLAEAPADWITIMGHRRGVVHLTLRF